MFTKCLLKRCQITVIGSRADLFVLAPLFSSARSCVPVAHTLCFSRSCGFRALAILIMSPEENVLSIEEALCRWFPTAASKLTLALGIVVLAAFIVPG
jgi:hypothetical protein